METTNPYTYTNSSQNGGRRGQYRGPYRGPYRGRGPSRGPYRGRGPSRGIYRGREGRGRGDYMAHPFIERSNTYYRGHKTSYEEQPSQNQAPDPWNQYFPDYAPRQPNAMWREGSSDENTMSVQPRNIPPKRVSFAEPLHVSSPEYQSRSPNPQTTTMTTDPSANPQRNAITTHTPMQNWGLYRDVPTGPRSSSLPRSNQSIAATTHNETKAAPPPLPPPSIPPPLSDPSLSQKYQRPEIDTITPPIQERSVSPSYNTQSQTSPVSPSLIQIRDMPELPIPEQPKTLKHRLGKIHQFLEGDTLRNVLQEGVMIEMTTLFVDYADDQVEMELDVLGGIEIILALKYAKLIMDLFERFGDRPQDLTLDSSMAHDSDLAVNVWLSKEFQVLTESRNVERRSHIDFEKAFRVENQQEVISKNKAYHTFVPCLLKVVREFQSELPENTRQFLEDYLATVVEFGQSSDHADQYTKKLDSLKTNYQTVNPEAYEKLMRLLSVVTHNIEEGSHNSQEDIQTALPMEAASSDEINIAPLEGDTESIVSGLEDEERETSETPINNLTTTNQYTISESLGEEQEVNFVAPAANPSPGYSKEGSRVSESVTIPAEEMLTEPQLSILNDSTPVSSAATKVSPVVPPVLEESNTSKQNANQNSVHLSDKDHNRSESNNFNTNSLENSDSDTDSDDSIEDVPLSTLLRRSGPRPWARTYSKDRSSRSISRSTSRSVSRSVSCEPEVPNSESEIQNGSANSPKSSSKSVSPPPHSNNNELHKVSNHELTPDSPQMRQREVPKPNNEAVQFLNHSQSREPNLAAAIRVLSPNVASNVVVAPTPASTPQPELVPVSTQNSKDVESKDSSSPNSSRVDSTSLDPEQGRTKSASPTSLEMAGHTFGSAVIEPVPLVSREAGFRAPSTPVIASRTSPNLPSQGSTVDEFELPISANTYSPTDSVLPTETSVAPEATAPTPATEKRLDVEPSMSISHPPATSSDLPKQPQTNSSKITKDIVPDRSISNHSNESNNSESIAQIIPPEPAEVVNYANDSYTEESIIEIRMVPEAPIQTTEDTLSSDFEVMPTYKKRQRRLTFAGSDDLDEDELAVPPQINIEKDPGSGEKNPSSGDAGESAETGADTVTGIGAEPAAPKSKKKKKKKKATHLPYIYIPDHVNEEEEVPNEKRKLREDDDTMPKFIKKRKAQTPSVESSIEESSLEESRENVHRIKLTQFLEASRIHIALQEWDSVMPNIKSISHTSEVDIEEDQTEKTLGVCKLLVDQFETFNFTPILSQVASDLQELELHRFRLFLHSVIHGHERYHYSELKVRYSHILDKLVRFQKYTKNDKSTHTGDTEISEIENTDAERQQATVEQEESASEHITTTERKEATTSRIGVQQKPKNVSVPNESNNGTSPIKGTNSIAANGNIRGPALVETHIRTCRPVKIPSVIFRRLNLKE